MIKVPCPYIQEVVQDLSSSLRIYYVDMQNILTYPDDYGCSGHPNVQGHSKMAKTLLDAVKSFKIEKSNL
jgi:hypothetical protein